MAKYLKKKEPVQRSKKQNKASSRTTSLRRARRNIYRQAALALLTVILTIVILFAMTSAWYTNIVQTSGLTFEAEAWGFNGTITIDDQEILAAPGDDGIINLTVQNDSDSVSAISVNVSKAGMTEEMQKRLFFYVDTRMNRNGETMERVYLNRYEGYTYNVFNNSQLTLTEQVSNAPVIKWEWVYDVLGYYVLAQPREVEVPVTTIQENEDGSTTPVTETVKTIQMDIKEYLRPIQYDFDEATTVIDTTGEKITVKLDTVDGEITPATYLYRTSKRDGYVGDVEPEDELEMTGFYKVNVDPETGYGIYAYLCNYTDIQIETNYDTYLAELANKAAKGELSTEDLAKLHHGATITLSAQRNENTSVNVTTLRSLQEAIALGVANVVQLSSDITVPAGEALVIPANSRVMVDLGGHTITNVDGVAIKAEPGSSLTMSNGTLIQNPQEQTETTDKTYGIYATGAEVVMNQVKINDFRYGIYMGDNENNNELDSRIHMADCKIHADAYAVFISGNGLLSEQKSQLIIENSTLSSNSIVITGNGDASGNGRWGTDIQIISSTIAGTSKDDSGVLGSGIYQPQKNSTLTVYESHVEGHNGITVKGGSVSIVDSTVKGLGAYNEPKIEGSGFTDTGDAIYVETSYGYEILLNISGSKSILTHTAAESRSLRVYEKDATNVQITIEGGKFDEEQPEEYLAENAVQNMEGTKAVVTLAQ